MFPRRIVPALAALACASPAFAAQLAIDYQARVTIQTSCIVSAGQLNFGSVGAIMGGETAVSTVNVVCSAGTPYTLSFSPFGSVTNYNGAMINGAGSVAYSANLSKAPALYTDNRTVYLDY
jgi:spore coat protein U-like protein